MKKKTIYIIIITSYAYFAGIVAHMLFPVNLSLDFMWGITAFCLLTSSLIIFLTAIGILKYKHWFVFGFIFSFLLFGFTRHLSAVSIPEHRIADILVPEDGNLHIKKNFQFNSTSRIKFVKESNITTDIVIRLSGVLKARMPDKDKNGLAMIDSKGRWMFHLKNIPIVSQPVIIKADDPIGKAYVIPQPFNSITSIVCTGGTGPAKISLLRISNHSSTFTRGGMRRPSVTILGKITHDPYVYVNRAMISITPDFIQYEHGGPYYKVDGGDIRTLLYPSSPNYYLLAKTSAYGYHVQARGELRTPPGPANPMDFDQRTYMKNHNLFGTLFVNNGIFTPVNLPDGSYARGNGLVEFSLDSRDKMLSVIKQTLPMPHSAFIGAITLGMRYGLASRPGLLSDYYSFARQGYSNIEYENYDKPHTGWEDTIEDQFKRSGVNHVLAVSGLHVTIITAMFVGIFMMFRIPKKMFAPITIFALVIFAIITGARPSTLRAVIMNSLFLLSWAYMRQGLRSAALFGLALAGFLILIHNPLMIVDPSFTLSFTAILSLVLLTTPAYEQLSKMKGNIFLVFLFFISITTILAIRKFSLFYTPSFLVSWIILWSVISYSAKLLQPKFHPIGDIGFGDLPNGFSTFFAAQFAIQVGMMVPLSSVYFMRWPLGGMYANIIAIPLAGVIIQLGMIAGLLGMIPVVGIYLALILNSANWIASSAFLLLSHVVARGCPWPFVPKWDPWLVVVYYMLLLALVYRKQIANLLRNILAYFNLKKRWHLTIFVVILCALLITPLFTSEDPDKNKLRISVIAVRYGSSILLQTPENKNILFDAGAVTYGSRGFNNTIRTVLTFLARKGILHLNAAVLTAPNIHRSAGMADVMTEYRVDKLYIPASISGIKSNMQEADFKGEILDGESFDDPETTRITDMYHTLVANPYWPKRLTLINSLYKHGNSFIDRWADMDTEIIPMRAGQIIYKETDAKGKQLIISVLHPDNKSFAVRPIDNRSSVIKIQYGDFNFLITSDLNYKGQKYLSDKLDENKLNADVMIVPGNGAIIPDTAFSRFGAATKNCLHNGLKPLIKKVNPDVVIFEYGDPKPILKQTFNDARSAYLLTQSFIKQNFPKTRILSTDTDQAIMITSDGKGYNIKTQAELRKDAGKLIGEGSSDIGYAF